MKFSRLLIPTLTLTFGVACGPAPTQTPDPSASPSAVPSMEPTAAPSSEPSAYPSASPTVMPSAEPTAAPSAMPSASPTALPSAVPSPSATPSVTPETRDNRDNFFKEYGVNPFVEANTDAFSTFAADVDTASYTLMRNYLRNNSLPPTAAVRTEEFVNFFNYYYSQPPSGKFAIHTEMAPSFFGDATSKLLRVGIQGQEILARNRKAASLTFVVDVSGSMNQDNRLELAKRSLRLLVEQLNSNDQVAIVIYGSEARTLLTPTAGSNKSAILSAIDKLRPEGSTNAEAGLLEGYRVAAQAMIPGGINRVILCSDGVANVGNTGPDAILARIKTEAENGINLTTVGFGMGTYNDVLMEQLANQGDGAYAYVDSLEEARRIFVENLTGTLQVLAKDMKIQVEFNPQVVAQYRLLGYENRAVADQDFRNDAVDAGEVGSNHSVTALYEVRFQPEAPDGKVADVRIRYKDVDNLDRIVEQLKPVNTSDVMAFNSASPSFRLATAVAEYAEILRQSPFALDGNLAAVLSLAQGALERYPQDTAIQEFVQLVQQAQNLTTPGSPAAITALVEQAENTPRLPAWKDFIRRQLGGGAL
jgi:Ca-activated chloride channel family protein